MDVLTDKPHRRSLLDHVSAVPDPRQSWRVAHPLPEVLLLVVCGTIAANDDYDDIVDWGEAHLAFLRRFSAFHFGLACADVTADRTLESTDEVVSSALVSRDVEIV